VKKNRRRYVIPLSFPEIRQRGVAMRPIPMGTPGPMVMTPPPGARPLLGPGGTPVGKGTNRDTDD